MKKNIILLFLLIIIFYSCKKDAAATSNSATILGKWHFSEQIYYSYTNNVLTSHEDYTTTLDPLSYFEFDANGVFIENPQDHNGSFNYGTYSVKGDSLFIKRDIDMKATHYFIKTLNSATLDIVLFNNLPPYSGGYEYKMKH